MRIATTQDEPPHKFFVLAVTVKLSGGWFVDPDKTALPCSNPHYYSPMATIRQASRKFLAANGLDLVPETDVRLCPARRFNLATSSNQNCSLKAK